MTPDAAFEALGGDLVDPPFILDAAVPLELSGEAVRGRLCVFQDSEGREFALRPDITLPIAVAEADIRAKCAIGETVRRYNAKAFRLPGEADAEAHEFTQIGAELFGFPKSIEIDLRVFEATLHAAHRAGATAACATLGDLGVFPAFVDALDAPPAAADALKRAFREPGGVAAILDRSATDNTESLGAQISRLGKSDAEAMVRDVFALSGIDLVGGRSVSEITERLRDRAALAWRPDQRAQDVMAEVLALNVAAGEAADALAFMARRTALDGLDDVFGALAERHNRIEALDTPVDLDARFGTAFGRRFNYYDGFLFELSSPSGEASRAFASGGRYDGLLTRLSAGAADATAVGGMVRPARIVEAQA
ncbi:MAG: ATP phosphoribosyltransferase regulatory subunit [Pseudomonadota bacterium]